MCDMSINQNIYPSELGWEQLDAFFCLRTMASVNRTHRAISQRLRDNLQAYR